MLDYARCDSHYLIPIYAMMVTLFENVGQAQDKLSYQNSNTSPFCAFSESKGLWLSEKLATEEWLIAVRTLSVSTTDPVQLQACAEAGHSVELVDATNKFYVQKMTRNHFKRVVLI